MEYNNIIKIKTTEIKTQKLVVLLHTNDGIMF